MISRRKILRRIPRFARVVVAGLSVFACFDTHAQEHAESTAVGAAGSDASSPTLVISEFLASNQGGFRDEDSDSSDWIEIYNRTVEPVDLAGWSLTDDAERRDKWVFPELVLQSGEYLVVFASDKNRRAPGGPLHTNFKLSANGEYLGLFDPVGMAHPSNVYAPAYPAQRANISFGPVDDGFGFLGAPTPGRGADATGSVDGLVPVVHFSRMRGHFGQPFSLELSSDTPGATIRYTLDGSKPASDRGLAYTAPISISTTTIIRAEAYRDGWAPSPPAMHTFIFPADVLKQTRPEGYPLHWGEGLPSDYAMDPELAASDEYARQVEQSLRALPTLSIGIDPEDIFGEERGIYLHTEADGIDSERAAHIEFMDPASGDTFSVGAGIRVQGRSSRKPETSPKHSLRVLFKSEYGPGRLHTPLYGEDGVDEFNTLVLRATSNYSWTFPLPEQRQRALYVRDAWAKDTQRAMGHAASRSRYVHLYINGLYWGVYCISERPDAAYMATHFGGRDDEYDVLKGGEIVDGDDRAWRMLMRIAHASIEAPETYARVEALLDIDNFIDYMILNHYVGNENWDYGNWYAARKRAPGGKFRFFCWDMESILGRVGESKLYVRNRDRPTDLYHRLLKNGAFRERYAERIRFHLSGEGVLTPESAAARLKSLANTIESAIVAESARWGDYRLNVHAYRLPPYERYTRDKHWYGERERLLTEYFPKRTAILLEQYQRAKILP